MFTFDMEDFGGSPCFTYLDYFKEGSERFGLNSVLALDLSKTSTGIAYWNGQTLETFNLKSSIKDLENVNREIKGLRLFRDKYGKRR